MATCKWVVTIMMQSARSSAQAGSTGSHGPPACSQEHWLQNAAPAAQLPVGSGLLPVLHADMQDRTGQRACQAPHRT